MPPIKRTKFKLAPEQLLEMFYWLKLIRAFDERLSVLVKQGKENLSPKGLMEKFTIFRMLSAIGHEDEMRLSCQCTVNGDCSVEVQPGMNLSGEAFWQKPYPNK